MKPSISITLARKLSLYTARFRDLVVRKKLDKLPAGPANHIQELFTTLKSNVYPELEPGEFAHHYALSLSSILLTAAFLAGDKERRKNLKQCLRDLMSVFHGASAGQEEKTLIVIMEILKSIKRVYIPIRLKKTILEAIDAFETVERGYEEEEYYLLLGFYEVFLEAYDPKLKKENGVFFTPYPVVSFIVRSLHVILKERLNRPGGLADQSAIILDPAAGTSTFLLTAARLAIEEFSRQNGATTLKTFAGYYLLNNLYGYEKLLPFCAISYLNFAHFLKGLNLDLKETELLNLFLTNTFEEGDRNSLFGRETTKSPVTVILGNPPYSRHPANKEPWITERIKDYFEMREGGERRLKEKNIKWLHDDYVKFIRFAQAMINRTGEGVMGFITNNAYLDGITFRAMRQSLMTSFSETYILNLHGNVMRKETGPDGSKDENVFPIRQGVAIAFFIKRKNTGEGCNVFYSDVWGPGDDKLGFLHKNDINSVSWQKITPGPGNVLFTPSIDISMIGHCPERYRCCFKVTDIFPVHSVGIVTARDGVTIQRTRKEVERTVSHFAVMDEADIRKKFKLKQDSRDWRVWKAQEDLIKSGPVKDKVVPILYRPFDVQFTYFTGNSRGFHCMPRNEVMKHMLFENIALVTVRQVAEDNFNHCFVADTIVDSRVTSSNRGICYVFPLYLYSRPSEKGFNINPGILDRLCDHMRLSAFPDAVKVFNYVYAVLHSPLYRAEFSPQLRLDFPRIPFPSSKELFEEIAGIGRELVDIHLLKSPDLDGNSIKFISGVQLPVKYAKFISQGLDFGKVRVCRMNYFQDVPKDIWEYRMCGYQVLPKLIRSYKGRIISSKEVEHVSRVIRALQLTATYQEKIDRLYRQIEKSSRQD